MRMSEQEGMAELVRAARERGWAMCGTTHRLIPGYTFTSGLTLYGGPARELVVCGLDPIVSSQLLEVLAVLTRHNGLDAGTGAGYAAGFLFHHAIRFRPVHPSWEREAFARGLDVVTELGAPQPPAWLQVLYPDKAGHWPEDPGCASIIRVGQPDLSLPYPGEAPAPS